MVEKAVELPPTEAVDSDLADFDQRPVADQLRLLLAGQAHAIAAVQACLDPLTQAIEAASERLRGSTGRLIYAGAGCSIRIGVQDGVELVPTFGWPLSRLAYLIAGGPDALAVSVEGAEDDQQAASRDVEAIAVSANDVVIGIAASGNTPYTCQVIADASQCGALTIGVSSNPTGQLLHLADHGLFTDTGAEVLAGSTRLAAGTAQKALLNAFSTTLMTALGRVLGNEMLCVQANNAKLKDRQARILIGQVPSMDLQSARELLSSVGWDLRVALLVAHGMAESDAHTAIATEQPFRTLWSNYSG